MNWFFNKKSSTPLIILLFFWPSLFFAQTANEIALRHIQQTAGSFGLSEQDINNYVITSSYQDSKNGLEHFYLRQTTGGKEIMPGNLNIHVLGDQVLYMKNRFIPNASSSINVEVPQISTNEAIQSALNHLGLQSETGFDIIEEEHGPDQEMIYSDGGISLEPIPVRLVYISPDRKTLKLAWELRIYLIDASHWWTLYVDALNGEILEKEDWVIHCNWAPEGHDACEQNEGRNSATKEFSATEKVLGPNEYEVYPMPVESPSHGTRFIATDPSSLAPAASPFGWHDNNGIAGPEFTITRGNNVHAYQDRNNNNTSSNDEPNGGATLDFTGFPIDLNQEPDSYIPGSVINLFYWTNILHDVWYNYGFDEAAGNFQDTNYGPSGLGGDYIRAEAQDAANSGTRNNANFSSGPDGSTARIQMYLWSAPSAPDIFTVNSPPGIAGTYLAQEAAFGPGLNATPITGNLVEVNDGSASPSEGCNALINGGSIAGNIALIDRGNCEFGTKVLNAENGGAIAAVVCNNVAGAPTTMGPGTDGNLVTIPSVMISQANCATIRAQLPGVNITLQNNGSTPERDGDLDNGIVSHEYGHGISGRLTGGPEANCLGNQEQMGEGWSDWFAMIMTMKSGDNSTDSRGMGTYAIGEPISGTGIRPAPYSSDFGINAYTYSDLANAEISVPHGVGFIWATMLWDLSWAFIDVYGFDPDLYNGTGGNNMAMQLIMDGMKLQGCSPGFVDGRDAILASDVANFGGIHECLIWQSFATRGLGFSADQGSENDRSDGTAGFDLPPSLSGLSLVKQVDITEIVEGGTLNYALQVRNICETNTNVLLSDTLPSNLTYVPGSASGGGSFSAGTVTYPNQPSFAQNSTSLNFFRGTVNPGSYFPPIALLFDDVEAGGGNWNTAGGTGAGTWVLDSSNPFAGTSAWYAEDFNSSSDQYLALAANLSLSGLTTLSFFHHYDTEVTWDGGVVEITIDNGATWTDLGPYMTQNGYNSFINSNPASAISRRPGFTGNSNGYIETIAELCEFSGQSVLIRFRMATDGSVGGDGWYIDNISLIDEAAVVNTGTVTADGRFAEATICSKVILLLADQITELRAEAETDHILVSWQNNDPEPGLLVLERRSETESVFTEIYKMNYSGSNQPGQFQDYDVIFGMTYYYQIKVIPGGGAERYSEVRSAKIDSDQRKIRVGPNPATDQVWLHYYSPKGEELTISWFDILGNEIERSGFSATSGLNTKQYPLKRLSPGIYILRIEGSGFGESFRLMVE